MNSIVQVSEAYFLSALALAAIIGFFVGMLAMWKNKF